MADVNIPMGPSMDALVAALEAISEVMETADASAAASAIQAAASAEAAEVYEKKVEDMAVSAVGLDPGETPTVTKTEEDTKFRLTFGIPVGQTGNGITSVSMTNDYKLVFTFTNGTTWTTPSSMQGPKGDSGTAENLGLYVDSEGCLCQE